MHRLLSVLLTFFLIHPAIARYIGPQVDYIPQTYVETAEYLGNPYCGYYSIYGYMLNDSVIYTDISRVPNIYTTAKERLVQIQFNLKNYSNVPLSDRALDQIDMILKAWCERTDYNFILRFFYDWDGKALETEPDNIDTILLHMEQTASVYNRYADRILMLHGQFTGDVGEMHHTHYGYDENIQTLEAKLAEVADPSIYLCVRTPNHWRIITGADSYDTLASDPQSPYRNRLGLFNDGMFGTDADTGTYLLPRVQEIAFQYILCQTVPNGGEVILDTEYNDFENAIVDLSKMHVSYLNSNHDLTALNKWKKAVYHGDDAFDGVSGFEYIRNHLGYRYVLRSSEIYSPDYRKKDATFRLVIENVGFSVSYRPFTFTLTMINHATGEEYSFDAPCDSSTLSAGETITLDIPLELTAYPSGQYSFYWNTTDDTSGEVIRYANTLPLTEHGYLLGTMRLEQAGFRE